MSSRRWRIAGISFDHMHMGDLLRMAAAHPSAEIVGVSDSDADRMAAVCAPIGIPTHMQFTGIEECLEKTRPDLAILCPATACHAEVTERVAAFGAHIVVEKPFAVSLGDADRMIRALRSTGRLLLVNWPLAWYPPHITTHRLIQEGRIGEVLQVHYYDGNRGPLRHLADKEEVSAEEAVRLKSMSWWYQKSQGGGSLQDYLGYGTTLGTWFHGGKKPLEVAAMVDRPPGVEVDEQSVTTVRYDGGLSTFQTRWGAFTDPWTTQPQPKCGFVVVGTRGTISSYDYEPIIRVQTEEQPEARELPVDSPRPPFTNPVEYAIHLLESGGKPQGPLSPETSRIGQQIVDTAVASAEQRKTLPLTE